MSPVGAEEELLRLPFGERIRYVRLEILRINQGAFAKRVGVSVRTVNRWEASFIAPSRENAEKIAALANLAAELFYPDDTVEPDPIVEVRQMLTTMEERFMTVSEKTLETLVEIQEQVARQTALLAAIEAKLGVEPNRSGGPKPRRSRRGKP
jgi:transcriptional regulator with XRE-family HTH domain